MTPRQFHLLWGRHREELLHREMTSAFITSAIINHSLYRPSEPVQPKDFMPNYSAPVKAEELEAVIVSNDELSDYRSRRAHISALLQQYKATGKADPYLVQTGLVSG